MENIIIIRGAPGVGKSTLAQKLRKLFFNGLTIEIGPMLKMINKFEDGNSIQYSDTLDVIFILAMSYIEKGYSPIMIVGPFKAARMEKYFINKLKTKINYTILTLIATNDDLSNRIDQRVNGFKNKEVAYVVNDDILKNDLPNEIRIDTSKKGIEEIFEETKRCLNLG